jgi:hypothetical protein
MFFLMSQPNSLPSKTVPSQGNKFYKSFKSALRTVDGGGGMGELHCFNKNEGICYIFEWKGGEP